MSNFGFVGLGFVVMFALYVEVSNLFSLMLFSSFGLSSGQYSSQASSKRSIRSDTVGDCPTFF